MKDQEITEEIIEEFGKSLQMLGFSSILGKAWMTLYLNGQKTQDELRKELGCGLSSISQALTTLENLGLVYISDKNGRKKIYRAESSFKTIRRNKMERLLHYYIEPVSKMLDSRADQVSDKTIKEKIKNLKSEFSIAGTLMRTILRITGGKEER